MSYCRLLGTEADLSLWLRDYDCQATHTYNMRAPDRWHIDSRTIDSFHLVMLRSGRAEYRVLQQRVAMKTGSIIVIGPGVEHGLCADPRNWPDICTCRFDLIGHGDGAVAGQFPPFAIALDSAAFPRRLRAFETVHRYRDSVSLNGQLLARNALKGLLLEIVQEFSGGDSELSGKGVERVLQYLQQYPQKRIGVDRLAQMAGLSLKHFHRHFLRATGMTPNQYQIRLRCEAAKMLLWETGCSVKEAAYQLGYPDQFSFSKQFKKYTGLSPAAFGHSRGEQEKSSL